MLLRVLEHADVETVTGYSIQIHKWTHCSSVMCNNIVKFRVKRSRGEMYTGHGRLCVRVSVCRVCVSVCPSPHSHTTARTL